MPRFTKAEKEAIWYALGSLKNDDSAGAQKRREALRSAWFKVDAENWWADEELEELPPVLRPKKNRGA